MKSVLDLLDNRVAVGDGCWEWLGAKYPTGYGKMTWQRKMLLPHRVVYELVKGPIPEGLHLDHLCSNKGCVNPSHLEAVTARENAIRAETTLGGKNVRKTHCPHGHEYTPSNTFRAGKNGRACRECARIASLAYYYRKKDERLQVELKVRK